MDIRASTSKTDMVDALRRYREILRWETNFLRIEVTSRGLETITGKKAYLQRHNSDGRSLALGSPQLVEQLSGQQIASLPLVSLPYLVPNQEEALDLLLHEAHKLGYRVQSLRELGVPISLETVRLLYLLSKRCAEICRIIARHGSPYSGKSNSQDTPAISAYKERRISWESIWASPVFRCGDFNDITTVSPMYFTPFAPGIKPHSGFATKALQIYSFKIFDLNDSLKWPLYVYGVVAARDTLDGNRNLIFSRSRANCQVLTEKDPFLHLTGPLRAILAEYLVYFEVELRMKDGAESQDKALMSSTNHHHFGGDTALFLGGLCNAEVGLQTIRSAVQATILSVRVVGGRSPFQSGVQVACSSSTEGVIADACRQVVLLNSVEKIPKDGLDGYLPLSRNVVTVKSKGSLRINIRCYTESGQVAHEAQLDFPAQHCQISTQECTVGDSKLQVVIAWSLLVRDKLDNMVEGYIFPL